MDRGIFLKKFSAIWKEFIPILMNTRFTNDIVDICFFFILGTRSESEWILGN